MPLSVPSFSALMRHKVGGKVPLAGPNSNLRCCLATLLMDPDQPLQGGSQGLMDTTRGGGGVWDPISRYPQGAISFSMGGLKICDFEGMVAGAAVL